MNIAIADDIPEETKPLKDFLTEYSLLNKLDLTIEDFMSAEALLEEYRPYRYTVIFLDIYMDGMTGVDAARKIRDEDSDTFLVFLTSSSAFMPEAFSLHAFEYMEKPVKREKVFSLLDDILKLKTDRSSTPILEFSCNRSTVRLPFENVVFVRSDGNYQEILDKDGNTFRTRTRFNNLHSELTKDPRFLLILRGMLVNMDYIRRFDTDVCYIRDDIRLPINQKNSEAIEQTWKNYIFQKIRKEHRGITV